MGYGGHVQDMINRMKQNRELNRARHERREKLMEALMKKSKSPGPDLKPGKPLSDKDREELNKLFKKERHRELALQFLAVFLAIAIMFFVGWYMFY